MGPKFLFKKPKKESHSRTQKHKIIISNFLKIESQRVVRGGAWPNPANYLRVAYRYNFKPINPSSYIGFRCVRSISPEGSTVSPENTNNALPKITWKKDGAKMSLIPAGSFEMGDHFNEGEASERPVHPVYVESFYMDISEVTNSYVC